MAYTKPLNFSVVSKPTGAACNLDCTYCFFLSKELLYDSKRQNMSPETLERYVKEYLAAQPDGPVTMLWQGGEPTLRGIDFFRKAFSLAEEYKRPGQTVEHALQTNATLINDDWAKLFARYEALVGVSIDGPAHLHDAYRVNKAGRGTHAQVIRGYDILRKHGVRVNILCTVHHANQEHGLEVYRYFRDDLQAEYLQFIPIVERLPQGAKPDQRWSEATALYLQQGHQVTDRSVEPDAYGKFLTTIFDEWIKKDVGEVFIQDIDSALSAVFGQPSVCVHAPECGINLAMEFNGDIYACDHWVEPDWLIGNIAKSSFPELAATPRMKDFSKKKRQELDSQCQKCPVLKLCWGGCPKDRFVPHSSGSEHNYLCAGYYAFYTHIMPDLLAMARLLQSGHAPAEITDPMVRMRFRPKAG